MLLGMLSLVVLVSLIWLLHRHGFLHLGQLHARADHLHALVAEHYGWAVLLYIGVFAAALAVSIPASAIMTTVGGFLFGMQRAMLFAPIAITLGSVMAVLLIRFLIGSHFQERYQAQLAGFNAAIKRDGAWYLLASRFSAVVPFFLINILAGLSNVSLWTFAWTTLIGCLPVTALYSFAGQQLYEIESVADLLSPGVIVAFVLLVLLTLAPIVGRYIYRLMRGCP